MNEMLARLVEMRGMNSVPTLLPTMLTALIQNVYIAMYLTKLRRCGLAYI